MDERAAAGLRGKAPTTATAAIQSAAPQALTRTTAIGYAEEPKATPEAAPRPVTMSPQLQAARARVQSAREAKAPPPNLIADSFDAIYDQPNEAARKLYDGILPPKETPKPGTVLHPDDTHGTTYLAARTLGHPFENAPTSQTLVAKDVTPEGDVPFGYEPRQPLDMSLETEPPDFTVRNNQVRQTVANTLRPSVAPNPSSANTLSWINAFPGLRPRAPQVVGPSIVQGFSPPGGAFNSMAQLNRALSPMMTAMSSGQPSNFIRFPGPGFTVQPSTPGSQNYTRIIPAAPASLTSDSGPTIVVYDHVSPVVGENVYDPDTGWHAR